MLKKPVISIVDDDKSVREGMMDLLKAMDFAVQAFDGAEQFLRSNSRHNTSCLITDVRMPGMSGVELYERLEASGNVIPTILITAFRREGDRERALKAGVAGYLTKPFSEDEMLACIRSALQHREAGGSGP